MATKPSVAADTVTAEQDVETTLLDVQTAAVKRLVARGKERGYITFDELNPILPPDQNSSEQIEDVMANFSEMGIQVVESEETEDGEAPVVKAEKAEEAEEEEQTGNVDEASLGRTDDPVRMYLREMGSVELLSREGEIAIAKRIEAGRDMMIGGLCESPLTFKAIISWHDQLKAGRMLLRDIIDLEATQGAGAPAPDGSVAPDPAIAAGAANGAEPPEVPDDLDGDDEGDGPGISLSALEEKLKPEVLATFEEIEALYKKLHKMQHRRLETMTSGEEVTARSEKTYERQREELVQQGRAGAAAQQPHRGTGHPAQAAQPAADRAGRPAAAHGRGLQGAARGVPEELPRPRARSELGGAGSPSCRPRAGSCSSPSTPPTSPTCAARSPRWRTMPACRSPSSAAST